MTPPTFRSRSIGDSDELKVGQEVVAVGNPLGELGGTVTNGIISALSRDVNIEGTEMTLIQTNAAVNPGNSGGGLFNMYGELIGIVNAKSTTSSSGTSVEGIAFAIPVNTAVKVSTELVNYGYVRGKVMLGISYIDIDSQMEAMYYRVSDYGVYVVSSEYTDELKAGDRIVGIDDEQVTYSSDIKAILKEHEVGDVVDHQGHPRRTVLRRRGNAARICADDRHDRHLGVEDKASDKQQSRLMTAVILIAQF